MINYRFFTAYVLIGLVLGSSLSAQAMSQDRRNMLIKGGKVAAVLCATGLAAYGIYHYFWKKRTQKNPAIVTPSTPIVAPVSQKMRVDAARKAEDQALEQEMRQHILEGMMPIKAEEYVSVADEQVRWIVMPDNNRILVALEDNGTKPVTDTYGNTNFSYVSEEHDGSKHNRLPNHRFRFKGDPVGKVRYIARSNQPAGWRHPFTQDDIQNMIERTE